MKQIHPRLLLISASDYQSGVAKGVASMLSDFDERGFFEHVLVAFPFARTSCTAQVSDRVYARDMGTDWLPYASGHQWVRRLCAPLHVLRSLILLVRAVRRDNINVVRATDPCFAGLIGWATARLTRQPFCVSIHADFDKRHHLGGTSSGVTIFGSRSLARAVEKFVLRRAEMVLPIRESLRPYAVALGARADRVRIIPHGTDLQLFLHPPALDAAAELGIPAGTRIISFAGRLVKENYVDDVIELARGLGRKRRDFTVVIMGGGPEQARLTTIVDEDPALREVVRMVGFQSRSVVASVRHASAVNLCLMGGYSLIEACATGSPVVSYDVEWHRELIRDGETGFLVAEHDLRRLETVVCELLDNPRLGAALGKAAKALAVSRHELEATSSVKRTHYLELLQGKAG